MAAAPRFKVYTPANEYIAACKYPEDAAKIVAGEPGATIRDGHAKIVWTEGQEEQPAAESCDFVAQTIYSRAPLQRTALRPV